MTLTDTHGNLYATGTGVSGSGTNSMTVTGSLSQVNSDLSTLQDADGTAGSDTITLKATDSLGGSATQKTIAVTANAAAIATVTSLSADTGESSTDYVTSAAAQTVSGTYTGTLGTGVSIQVSADGGTTWVTATASAGSWSASGVTLSAGAGNLSVRTVDARGGTTSGAGHSYILDQSLPSISTPVTLGGSVHNWTLSGTYTDTGAGVYQVERKGHHGRKYSYDIHRC